MPLHQLSSRQTVGPGSSGIGHASRQAPAPNSARQGWSAHTSRSPTRVLRTDDFPALGGASNSGNGNIGASSSAQASGQANGGGDFMGFRYDRLAPAKHQQRADDFPALGETKDLQAHRNSLLGAMTGGRSTPGLSAATNAGNATSGRSRMQAPPNLSLMSGPPALDAPPKATDRDGVPVPSYAPGLSATGPQGLPSNASSKEEPLVSEADRYTIRGLLPIIRNPQSDHAMLSLGLDLTHLGLKLGADDDRLLSTLWLTPFADPNAPGGGGQVPLSSTDALANRFTPPACYVMGGISAVLPEASNKIANFTEETLFYIFYVQPRSKMQELAAQELTSRNWRFHKVLGVWLTKEPGVEPSVRTTIMERGQYIFWDASRWERVKKVFELFYEDLEDRFGSAHGVATEAGVPVQGQSQGHDL